MIIREQRALRSIGIVFGVLAGAVLFFAAGLGAGLHIADTTAAVAALPTQVERDAIESPPPGPPTSPTVTRTPSPATPSADGRDDGFDIFWEAWDILRGEFYGELPPESELPYAAIEGVIATTGDPYTAFLDPVRAEIVSTSLSGGFDGIGATVRMRADGKLEIVHPLPGLPAIEAGLRAGDVILEVDGVEIEGMSLYEAISMIRGPVGTVVRLLVEREGVDEAFIIEVERAHIELPVVESRMLEDSIAYVRLRDFGQTATRELEDALRDLNAEDPRALILDLRGNRGGYLSVAVEVTSQFIRRGPILIERFKDGSEETYTATRGGLALDLPLVVLVDGGSASASEIAAGAIQDTGRGVLIGTTTLGKGSVQLVHTLSDGSQLRVTVARWFTPKGRAIHGEGLAPDIEVEMSEDDVLAGRDPQLDRAVEYLLEGK